LALGCIVSERHDDHDAEFDQREKTKRASPDPSTERLARLALVAHPHGVGIIRVHFIPYTGTGLAEQDRNRSRWSLRGREQ
jgi:hypothetical protein